MDSFLIDLWGWLKSNKELTRNNAQTVSNAEMVANAIIEKVAIMLLQCADIEDQAGRYNKSTVTTLYVAGMLLDVCMVFGQISEDLTQHNKYAKWRASYLLDCLNTGKEPSDPGPKPANSTPVLQDSASASQNSLSPQRQFILKSEPMELAQQFCKKASKALALKDISSAKDNLTAAIILYKKQKKAEISTGTTNATVTVEKPEPIEEALLYCKHASTALNYKDFPTAYEFFCGTMVILNQVEKNASAEVKVKGSPTLKETDEKEHAENLTAKDDDAPTVVAGTSSTVLANVQESNINHSFPSQVIEQVQVFCKRASISLTHQDVLVARDNLRQALILLKKEIKLVSSTNTIRSSGPKNPTVALNESHSKLVTADNLEGSKLVSWRTDTKIRQSRRKDPNAWKPAHASKTTPDEENPEEANTRNLIKTVRGFLNKLTPSNFDKLLAKIQSLTIDTEKRLAGVIRLVFEKAVREPQYSGIYAKMCQALSTKEVTSSYNSAETTNFRKLLLTRCQQEFEKDSAGLVDVENKKKEIEENEDEAKKKELEDELEDLTSKYRRQYLGNMRFIGELFKFRILSAKVIHQCIVRLLAQPDDEESLECLCRLLTTIGNDLESSSPTHTRLASNSNEETMDLYFRTLDHILKERKLSNRIRFIIMDVIDLRKSDWKSRREEIVMPTTIDQIREEVNRDEQERELSFKPKHYVTANAQASQRNWRKQVEGLGSGNIYPRESGFKPQSTTEGDKRGLKGTVPDSKEWLQTSNVPTFIRQCLVLENNIEERRAIGTLLKKMIRTKRFTVDHILEGIQEVLQGAEKSFVDIPKLWEYLAQLIQPIFEDGIVAIGFLGTLAAKLNPSVAPHFVAATLKELVHAQGGMAEVERLWNLSNISFNSILPGVDLNAFINEHKELGFLLKMNADREESSLS